MHGSFAVNNQVRQYPQGVAVLAGRGVPGLLGSGDLLAQLIQRGGLSLIDERQRPVRVQRTLDFR